MESLNLSEKAFPIILGAVAGALRLMVTDMKVTVAVILSAVVLGSFVGYLVGGVVQDLGWTPGFKGAAIGASALLSREIAAGLVSVGQRFQKDPIGFIQKIRGGKRNE